MSAPETSERARLAAVVIGRNEGARLGECLAAIPAGVPVVYVDSGSTDGSMALAEAAGATVVRLSAERPFSAARARNAGVAALEGTADLVQFVDGDCTLVPGWLEAARTHLAAHPRAAVVCGRRRERFPEASVWNRLADREWDTPLGPALACGGDALMRVAAFDAAGGFAPELIAGEEPDLCARLRGLGWEVWRIDAEMTRHDAAMTRFGQWWRRARRAGHAAAEGHARHGGAVERAQIRRAVIWAGALPAALLAGLAVTPWAGLLALSWPAQVLRLALRAGGGRGAWEWAAFATLGKLPELLGVLEYHLRRRFGRPAGLIEYKPPAPPPG